MNALDPFISCGILVANFAAVIGRAVVNKHYLKITEALSQYAVNASADIRFDIIDGYYNAELIRGIFHLSHPQEYFFFQ